MMCALWDDPPYVRDPSDGISSGKYRVTELATYDHDEWGVGDFDTIEAAVQCAREKQEKRSHGYIVHRVWNDKQRVIETISSTEEPSQ
jgi:hypothetical protein